MKLQFRSLLLAALVLGAGGAQAALTTYDGLRNGPPGAPSGDPLAARTAFLANLGTVGVETFSGFAVGAPGLPADPFDPHPTMGISFTPLATTGTLSGDYIDNQLAFEVQDNAGGNGRYDTTGSGDRFLVSRGSFLLTFSEAVNAFGFYGTDIGDFGSSLSVILTPAGGGATVELEVQPSDDTVGDGALLFWGFVDTEVAYSSIQFVSSAVGIDGLGFDDLTIGTLDDTPPPAVPEPASLALGGLALLSLGLVRRRRR